MKERGSVIELSKGGVKVRLPNQAGCSSCGRCVLGKGGKYMILEARNEAGGRPGDEVEVEIPRRDPLLASLLLFGLPLLGFLIGVGGGYYLAIIMGWEPGLPALLAGVLLLAIAFIRVRRHEAHRKEEVGEVRVVSVVGPAPDANGDASNVS